MSMLWLILSLLAIIFAKLESLMLRIGTFFYMDTIMIRILALRPCNRINFPLPSKPAFISAGLSQLFKSQLYNTPQRTLVTHSNKKIPKHLEDKISRRLDTSTSNPIGVVSQLVRDFFNSYNDPLISTRKFNYFPIQFAPISITENFDELQVPLDHVSRDPSDTYYLDEEYVLKYKELKKKGYLDIIKSSDNGAFGKNLIKFMADAFGHSNYNLLPTHTTSHLTKLLRQGITQAIYSGQVFRRDEIDSQHYPVFHQLDGYLLFTREDLEKLRKLPEYRDLPDDQVFLKHLKTTLENLVGYLYSFVRNPADPDPQSKVEYSELGKFWDDKATFPFTFPSSEFYVNNQDQLTEILGCGVLKNLVLENNFKDFGNPYVGGWAFGIGLERLAMVLCKIFDIRQFWETDERFLKQYEGTYEKGFLPVFAKYSRNPPVVRDVSFYLSDSFDEELFKTLIVENGRGYVENVEFVSSYFNEKLKRKSLCYRVVYRAFQENLTNSFVNSLHQDALRLLEERFNLTIR